MQNSTLSPLTRGKFEQQTRWMHSAHHSPFRHRSPVPHLRHNIPGNLLDLRPAGSSPDAVRGQHGGDLGPLGRDLRRLRFTYGKAGPVTI